MQTYAVGKHRLFNCDITEALEIPVGKQDIVYTDPPWNVSLLKMFYKRAGFQTGNMLDDSVFIIFTAMAQVIRRADPNHVFVEMGVEHWHDCVQCLITEGFYPVGIYDVTYTSKRLPMKLIHMAASSVTVTKTIHDVQDRHEWAVFNYVADLYIHEGTRVLDTFCGRCQHLGRAAKRGAIVTGIELFNDRLLKGVRELAKYEKVVEPVFMQKTA